MRKILFRGKRQDNGKWVEGYVAKHIFAGYSEYLSIDVKQMKARYAQRTEYTYQPYEVIPETVGQYTGLEDKNGKMIFEGDIVLQPVRETRKHSPCIIEFHKGAFMAHYKSEDWFFDRYYNINSFTKIIGNIHDNPELLEVQDSDR